MAQKFINNAKTILSNSIAAGDLVMSIRAGDGSLFPALGNGDFVYLTLIEYDGIGNEINWEIVKATNITVDTLTIERAQEGTTAQIWLSGTRVQNRFTAGTASSLAIDAEISTVGKTNNYNDLANKPNIATQAVSAIKADAAWNATDWDIAVSWGDHNAMGYIDDYTETDPTVPAHVKTIAAGDIASWNTAHGWGNWATGVNKAFVDALGINATTLGGQALGALGRLGANQTWTGLNTFPATLKTDGINTVATKGYVDKGNIEEITVNSSFSTSSSGSYNRITASASRTMTLNSAEVGTQIVFSREGIGTVTFAAGTNQTINSVAGPTPSITNQYGAVTALCVATNSWVIHGDVS